MSGPGRPSKGWTASIQRSARASQLGSADLDSERLASITVHDNADRRERKFGPDGAAVGPQVPFAEVVPLPPSERCAVDAKSASRMTVHWTAMRDRQMRARQDSNLRPSA